jgi:hypothetical protein
METVKYIIFWLCELFSALKFHFLLILFAIWLQFLQLYFMYYLVIQGFEPWMLPKFQVAKLRLLYLQVKTLDINFKIKEILYYFLPIISINYEFFLWQFSKRRLISSYFSVVLSVFLVYFYWDFLGLLLLIQKKLANDFRKYSDDSFFLKQES